MSTLPTDNRSAARRALDEQVGSEPMLPPPMLSPDAVAKPMEAHRGSLRQPVAISGIVENGVVRPLDPSVKLKEHSRVIIVAAE
jgi:hypothetical protein